MSQSTTKTMASSIDGTTTQLTATGTPTTTSWSSLEDLLESINQSISSGYVTVDHNGYDYRNDYRCVRLWTTDVDMVIVAYPQWEDSEDEPNLEIRVSLSSLLGWGATMQPVVDAFIAQVKKSLLFDL